MGKIRIKILGTEEEEDQKAKQAEKRRQKKLREQAKGKDEKAPSLKKGKSDVEATPGKKKAEEKVDLERKKKKKEVAAAFEEKPKDEKIKETEDKPKADKQKEEKIEKKEVKKEPVVKTRTKRYQSAAKLIDPTKLYKPEEALELAIKTSTTSFDGSVEAHLNVVEKGIKASLTFPHSTGKTKRVVICDDKVLAEIEKGKLDFDVLLAEPIFMSKLAKFAKVLGPKGLMPNPKQGTVTTDPQNSKKEIEGGKQVIKTEPKAPIIHTIIGKVSQPKKELMENLSALIGAIDPNKIEKMVLSTTMGPSIKVEVGV